MAMTNPLLRGAGAEEEGEGDIRLNRCWGNCEWSVNVAYEEREEDYEIRKANNEDNNIHKGC